MIKGKSPVGETGLLGGSSLKDRIQRAFKSSHVKGRAVKGWRRELNIKQRDENIRIFLERTGGQR